MFAPRTRRNFGCLRRFFSLLKWIGAGYLIYLGIKLWRTRSEADEIPVTIGNQNRSLFKSAFVVTALNPKSIAFFVAFLPQFVDPRGQAVPQLLLLGATFLSLAAVNAMLYALFAGQLRDTMQNSRVRRWFNRLGGTALIGAGIVTATLKRAS
jgi:threonine/homoserine/homoserine lactone efflux protein